MNKIILFVISLASEICYSQIYTPTGGINGITNNVQTGNVGIGTNSPQAKLDVNGNLRVGNNTFFQFPELVNIGNGNNQNVAMVFGDTRLKVGYLSSSSTLITDSQNAQILSQGGNENLYITSRGNSPSRIIFHTSDGSGLTEKMRISPNGNIGIGTINPQSKLEVNGDITLGNITSHEYNVVFRPDDNSWRSALIGFSSSIANDDYIGLKTKFGSIRFITNDGYESVRITNGRLGVGTTTPQALLDIAGTSSFSGNMKVNAKVEAKEVKVTTTPTADFVFAEDYQLPNLEEVEKHIKEKKHLPEIASAKEMEKEGVNVGEFQIKLLQKIEELTLYSIEQNKQIKIQQEQIKQLEVQNKELLELKKMVQELKGKTNQ